MKIFGQILSGVMVITILALNIPFNVLAKESTQQMPSTNNNEITSQQSYEQYCSDYSQVFPNKTISVDLSGFQATENHVTVNENLDGNYAIETSEEGEVGWKIEVSEEGFYQIKLKYYNIEGKGSSILRSFMIDGKIPFSEAGNLCFERTFANQTEFEIDNNGNQIRPTQIEKSMWREKDFSDPLKYYDQPLYFYFTKGQHQITLKALREPVAIGGITLYQAQYPEKYQIVREQWDQKGYKNSENQEEKIQGEAGDFKSDSMIYPLSDKSSVTTDPTHYNSSLINTIGGAKWQRANQWITWKFNVEQSGYYKLGIKARQNTQPGQTSYRKILIDQKVPFEEFNAVEFEYSQSWKMFELSEQDKNLVYLEKGSHEITMEVSFGKMAELIREVDGSIKALNSLYRNFLMVIGASPDTNRDYQFESVFPEQLVQLKKEGEKLKQVYQDYLTINKGAGTQGQILKNLIEQIERMVQDTDSIAKQFTSFASNISSLGTWMQNAVLSPLEIDYLIIISPDKSFPKATVGFWSEFIFDIKQFFSSFSKDYDSLKIKNQSINVWLSTGRDQANALNQIVKDDFSAKFGCNVKVELVPPGALLTATLAKKGPDIALSLSQTDIMNYAFRGALADLQSMPNFNDVSNRFQLSANRPLGYNNKQFALPETQNFPMLFYREDVFQQLGLSVPQTWDDVIEILPILQKKNMNFGLPIPYNSIAVGAGFSSYLMFLYQNGGNVYNEDGSRCVLNDPKSIEAFTQWTNFYTEYSLLDQYDFITQFRSGETPIGIADYSTYNSLSVFAPELNGIWKFSVVPGKSREDQTINRTVASTVTGAVILSDAKNKDMCWEFLKWWTSSNSQHKYASEIESIMGPAGRYQTANIEALYSIPWSTADFKILMEQWKETKEIPEVPGSYMTPRYLDFGFKQAVVNSTDGIKRPGQILINQTTLINDELKTKREEFGY